MKQVIRALTTYSADLFGINSALYELGGLCVMHDASGCNSTYNTHDEPRWYTMDSMVYISGLTETDAILGNDQKLIDDVCEVADEMHPKFIALSGSPIPLLMATDFRGISKIIQKRTGIPTFGFYTNSMNTYVTGAGEAFNAIAECFCDDKIQPNTNTQSVNLLGATPLDFSTSENIETLKLHFKNNGIKINSCWAMGDTLENMATAGSASVNVVISSTGLDAAKTLQRKYGTPYVIGIPIGRSAGSQLISLVKEAAEDGKNRRIENGKSTNLKLEQSAKGGCWIIGEPVFAASLRICLEQDLGIDNVHIICPMEYTCDLLRPHDVKISSEEDIEECLNTASLVIGDPIYRRILKPENNIQFLNFPHEAYSGRMYSNSLPVFTGSEITDWLKNKIEHPEVFINNDININNHPFNSNNRSTLER